MDIPLYLIVCERDGQRYILTAAGLDGAESVVLKLDGDHADQVVYSLNEAYGEETWATQKLEKPPLLVTQNKEDQT